MNCNCFGSQHYQHKVLTLTNNTTSVNMTVSNATNISSLDCFELLLCTNPNTVVFGAPLPYTITINGSTAQLYNKYHLPIYTNRLNPRKKYYGAYVNNGTDAWVELFNTPDCAIYATPNTTTIATTQTPAQANIRYEEE